MARCGHQSKDRAEVMKLLIAGGQGFVGLNLAEQVLSRHGQVILFGPASAPPAFMQALQALPGELHVVTGDIASAEDVHQVLTTFQPDHVVNAAAITAGASREITSAREIFRVNMSGTLELLEACLQHGVRRMVQLGTGSVFGEAGQWSEWLDEQTSAAMPESLYGISKFAAERTCIRYARQRGLDITVLRLGTVFGRWEYETGVRDTQSIPLQLLKAAFAGQHAVLYKDCADDWVYSLDVAQGILAALADSVRPAPLYHLSSGMPWDVAAWCQKLAESFAGFSYELSDDKSRCTIGRNASPKRSPMRIDRIKTDLGYAPHYLADAAFDDFVAWGMRYLMDVRGSSGAE